MRKNILLYLSTALIILGIVSPWLVTKSLVSALQFNLYDLAEWVSLHPTVRATSPWLLPALSLRIGLVIVGLLLISLMKHSNMHYILGIGSFVIGVTLIPPPAFLNSGFSDINYAQQFLVWIVYISSIIVLLQIPKVLLPYFQIALTILAVITGLWGMGKSIDLISRYSISLEIGWGGYSYMLGMAFLGGYSLLTVTRNFGGGQSD